MSEVRYNLIDVSGTGNITVVFEDEMQVANSEHPNWEKIVELAKDRDPEVMAWFDRGKRVAEKFDRLSERVLVSNGHVFFDGEPMDNALTKQVLRFLDEGVEDWKPLVNFFEKVMLNPQEHSREQLFRFLENHNITILEDGDFFLYKGVRSDGEGGWTSISTGRAIVNGIVHNGAIPQPLDGIVEMPRGEVAFEPGVACHTGLHAGTFSYANGFGNGNVIKVKINPRDVVSVPTDSYNQKVRVCRYTVMTIEVTKAETTSVYEEPEKVETPLESAATGDRVRLIGYTWYSNGAARDDLNHYGVAIGDEGTVVDGSAAVYGLAGNLYVKFADFKHLFVAPESLALVEANPLTSPEADAFAEPEPDDDDTCDDDCELCYPDEDEDEIQVSSPVMTLGNSTKPWWQRY